jgi:hypothetical protein
MALSETDIRAFILRKEKTVDEIGDEVTRRILEGIKSDPAQVVQDLYSAREAYIQLVGIEAPTTLAYSPLRAACAYLEFNCRRGFEQAASRTSGKAADFLTEFADGMAEVAWGLVTSEDAVAIGVKPQTYREVEEQLRSIPEDDKNYLRPKYQKFGEMRVKRRMKRLIRDYSGKTVAEGELHDMMMLASGNLPYPVRPPYETEELWNDVSVK